MVGRVVGWFDGWLDVWLDVWLVGWLDGEHGHKKPRRRKRERGGGYTSEHDGVKVKYKYSSGGKRERREREGGREVGKVGRRVGITERPAWHFRYNRQRPTGGSGRRYGGVAPQVRRVARTAARHAGL